MQEEEYLLPQMVDEVRAGRMPRRAFMKQLTSMGITTAGISAIVASISTSSTLLTAWLSIRSRSLSGNSQVTGTLVLHS